MVKASNGLFMPLAPFCWAGSGWQTNGFVNADKNSGEDVDYIEKTWPLLNNTLYFNSS